MDNQQKACYLNTAREVFEIESAAVGGLVAHLDQQFTQSVEAILALPGRVIVCGMGKSGIIAKKIAATMASTGTPAFFMHPAEAIHGDLGMVAPDDLFLALSHSGETEELVKLLPFLLDNGNTCIAITGNPASTLAQGCHLHLSVCIEREACPLQLAPTASTTATLAMGDALAVALMRARGFQPHDFARIHPGGSLGRRLLHRVQDEMRSQDLPLVTPDANVDQVMETMTRAQLGIALVASRAMRRKWHPVTALEAKEVGMGRQRPAAEGVEPAAIKQSGLGIITDGDLRRALQSYGRDFFSLTAGEIMTPDPITIPINSNMQTAIELMAEHQITLLVVTDGDQVAGVVQK